MKNTLAKHEYILMNGVEIDIGMSNLIQKLWDNDFETIQCCQGGDETKRNFDFFIDEQGIKRENAHLIFLKKDLDRIKEFLPENAEYIIGDKEKKGVFNEWLGTFDAVWASWRSNHYFELNCRICKENYMGEYPKGCCDGKECGCMGLPIDPAICSEECWKKFMDKNIFVS